MSLFRFLYYQTFTNQVFQHSQRFLCVKIAMDHILKPPEKVHLMQTLDRGAFEKVVSVPVLNIKNVKISSLVPLLKPWLLKLENHKPVNQLDKDNVAVSLNPQLIQKWEDLPEAIRTDLITLKVSENDFEMEDLRLGYENFSIETVLRAVLPKDKEGLSSYTKVGDIVHVNLREHLIPYRDIIGEVLFDKVKGCKSVVNKVNMIDNTYRNFQMEVLKGTDNMHTTVKENNCRFEFDFSTVYWNSRLSTEHERIIKVLKPGDVLFDVFAGVGPFSIPAAKKKCIVFANDLNPESYKWLLHNKKLNKISDELFKGFNLDGRQFILEVFKENLPKYYGDRRIFIVMNLPALAVEFLDAFLGLFDDYDDVPNFESITLYVYCFAKGEHPEKIARELINDCLKAKITDIFKVRTVSSMKEMMRVTLSLDRDVLVGLADKKRKLDCVVAEEPKKLCIDLHGENGQKQQEKHQRVQSSGSKGPESEN